HRLQAALGRTLSKNESEDLTGLLSSELVSSAIAAWFPHLTAEVTALRAGTGSAGVSPARSQPAGSAGVSPARSQGRPEEARQRGADAPRVADDPPTRVAVKPED